MVYPKVKGYGRQGEGRPKQRLFRDFSRLPRKLFVGTSVLGLVFLYSLNHSKKTPLPLLSKVEMLYEGVRGHVSGVFAFWEQIGEGKEKLRSRVLELEKLLRSYEQELADAAQLREENEALRGVLPLVKERQTLTVVAKPKPGHPFLFVTYPDADMLEQIEIGALAVAPQGLVGTVVAKDGARVLLLLATQIQSRIPVRSCQSHQRALLLGRNSPFFAIKYTHREIDEGPEGASVEASQEAPIFIKESDLKKDFVDGEILELCDVPIPVARIVHKNGKILAEWLVQTPSKYITLILK